MIKRCSKCKESKSLSSFTKNKHTKSGLNYWCKECTRKNSQSGYFKNRTYRLKQVEEYHKTDKGRNVLKKSVKKWIDKNPEKSFCHQAVLIAKRKGLIKESKCQFCGEDKVVAHHEDYTKPLEVTWLCRQHHKDLHRGLIVLQSADHLEASKGECECIDVDKEMCAGWCPQCEKPIPPEHEEEWDELGKQLDGVYLHQKKEADVINYIQAKYVSKEKIKREGKLTISEMQNTKGWQPSYKAGYMDGIKDLLTSLGLED